MTTYLFLFLFLACSSLVLALALKPNNSASLEAERLYNRSVQITKMVNMLVYGRPEPPINKQGNE